jgi:hypothetical protein
VVGVYKLTRQEEYLQHNIEGVGEIFVAMGKQ